MWWIWKSLTCFRAVTRISVKAGRAFGREEVRSAIFRKKRITVSLSFLMEVLGGWASRDSYVVFGQWLQAMARFSRASGESEMRERAAPLEWSTVAENLFRAHEITNNDMYKAFAEVWLYDQFWNKFRGSAAPPDAVGVHAYSHVNSLSGAAMAYDVSGEDRYLRIMRNAYDFMPYYRYPELTSYRMYFDPGLRSKLW